MVRLVEEAIEVRMADSQHMSVEGQPGDGRGGPEQFLWRGRLYLDCLTRGLLPSPTTTTATGRQVIAAPLPGGRITAADVDLGRMASGLGVDASRLRRGPDVPGMLTVEVLDVSPADLPVPAWPALGTTTDWTSSGRT